MTLISKSDVGGQSREVALPICQPLEHRARTKSHAVTGDRITGRSTKDAAEVMGRNRDGACELRKRQARLDGECLACVTDDTRSRTCGRGTPFGNPGGIFLF